MKNNQKGFANFILIGVVVILAVGGYFAWSKKSNQTTQDINPITISSEVKNSEPKTLTSTTTDETVGWKTYINNTWEFTLKYPSNYKVMDYNVDRGGEILVSEFTDPTFYETVQIRLQKQSSFKDMSGKIYSSVEEFARVDAKNKGERIKTLTTINFGLENGIDVIGEYDGEEGGPGEYRAVYILKDSLVYVFSTQPNNQNFYKILSTFKFTE